MIEYLLGLILLTVLIVVAIKLSNVSGEVQRLRKSLDDHDKRIGEIERKRAEAAPQSKTAEATDAVQAPEQPAVAKESEGDPAKGAESQSPPDLPTQSVAPRSQPPPLKPKKEVAPPPVPIKPKSDPLLFLRDIGLWPPKRTEGSSELVLMQWWAPRIGGGLAILSIIFFAVYVAQGTAPWVKFMEMLVASFAVFGLGLYFTRKRPGLGNVLVATGLSMIYISSVAGYAVGPVKVVDNPVIGALMQLAALVLNFGMGTWKKERGILVLALVFGYASSLFAALEGFREAALISSLLVYLAGLFSYRRIGGLTLVSISLAGVYLPLAGFIGIEFIKAAPVYPNFWSVIAFTLLTVSVLPGCKLVIGDSDFLPAGWNRLYQSLNTSLAVVLGFVFVAYFYPLGKTEFYGVVASLFIGWSLIWFGKDVKSLEFHLFFLKGSALASLWFINFYHGDIRWMALGIQVIVLAASVHRSRSVWVEIITVATWLLSYRYFAASDLNETTGSFLWFMQGTYLLVSVGGLAYLMNYTDTQLLLRRILYSFPSLLLFGVAFVFAAEANFKGIDPPGITALMSLLVLLIALIPFVRSWIPILTGGLIFFASHVAFWIEPSGRNTLLTILFVSAAGLFGLLRSKITKRDVWETLIHGLWVITVLYYLKSYEEGAVYHVVVALFAVLLFVGGFSPLKRLPEVCALPLLFLILHPPPGEYPTLILVLFLLIVGSLANVGIWFPRYRQFVHFLKAKNLLWWLLNALFIVWAGWVFPRIANQTSAMLLWSALATLCFVIWYARGLTVSFVAVLVCAAIPVFQMMDLWLNPASGGLLGGAPWAGQVLLAGILLMILWLLIGGYTRVKPHPMLSDKGQTVLAWFSGSVAYLVFAAAFDYPLLNWERLYTPFLGAFSIGLIVLGIVLKSRPYRFVAMLTFLVPLFRLFVYDIRETLYRIIAFAVLAVVLTIVGFLYQKFSSRIE